MKKLLLFLSFCLFAQLSMAQDAIFDLDFEFQAYPTGLIPGIRLEKGFSEKNAVHLRLGYNWIRHGDAGVKEDERGDGYGFTLGYKRYFKPGFKGWFLGIRNDIWFNTLEWKDYIDTPWESSGTSEIIVVQPTAETGYLFILGSSIVLTPTVGFGYEINVKEEGGDVGEGAILLLGINLGKRF